MVQKRKAISTIAKTSRISKATAKGVAKDDGEEAETQLVPVAPVMKKTALQGTKRSKVEEEDSDEDEDVEQKEISPERALAQREQQITIERTQELKSMYMEELKKFVSESGIATGTKDVMIKALLKHEAKARAESRAHEAKIRAVVITKKEELENTPMAELSKLCDSIGITGVRAKPDRVARLLVHWQKHDGVDKALAQIEVEDRKNELGAMDNASLHKLCEKAGLDPFVKEVIVDRISKKEQEIGRYMRAASAKETTKPLQDVDMVDTLLANESTRKQEKNQEDDVGNKKTKLKAMGVDELRKALTKKRLDANGKKEDMVEALFAAIVQEQAVVARKAELKKIPLHDLKGLLSSEGLEVGGKEKMIEAILAHEAKRAGELKVFDTKFGEILEKRKEELLRKSNADLKGLCQSSGLAVGGGKDDRVDRLLEEVRNDGSIEKEVSVVVRGTRKEELMKQEKEEVVRLCEELVIDPYLKDVMIERIVSYETEVDEPVTKKARKK